MSVSLLRFKAISQIIEQIEKSSWVQIAGPWGVGKSVIPYLIHSELNKPLLVIASDNHGAEEIYEDFITFTSEEDCAFFPSWETLPTDFIDPAEDIVSERLHLLTRIVSGKQTPKIIVTSIRSLLQVVPSREALEKQRLHLNKEQEYNLEDLTTLLINSGYQREASVSQHGEFSRRGGILDIFPYARELPVRLEFFGDIIESIREFDPETQKKHCPSGICRYCFKNRKRPAY